MDSSDSAKRIQLFNPNQVKVDQAISKLNSILTSYSIPSDVIQAIRSHFCALLDTVPMYDFGAGSQQQNADFDPFWREWLKFRGFVLDYAARSVADLSLDFMNEKFDQFTEIMDEVKSKPPQKVPAFREFDKSKKNLQTAFENLMQILLEQFDGDITDEQKIRNLMSQRTKIRRIKTDIQNKFGPFFDHSQIDGPAQHHQRCVQIVEEILVEINELQKQAKDVECLRDEIVKAEERLLHMFPPRNVEMRPVAEIVREMALENDEDDQMVPLQNVRRFEFDEAKDAVSEEEEVKKAKHEAAGKKAVPPLALQKKPELVFTPKKPEAVPRTWNTDVKQVQGTHLPQIKPLDLEGDDDFADTMRSLSMNMSDVSSDSASSGSFDFSKKIQVQPPLSARVNRKVPSSPPQKARMPASPPRAQIHLEMVEHPSITLGPDARQEEEEEENKEEIHTVKKINEELSQETEKMKAELAQLKDDYDTILVQLEVSYEDNKEMQGEVEKLKAEIESSNEEKEALKEKVKSLQDVLVETPTQFYQQPLKVDEDSSSSEENVEEPDQQIRSKLEALTKERESLYGNIEKLADENASLKERLLQSNTPHGEAKEEDTTALYSQIRNYEELQDIYDDEITRVHTLLDSLLKRIETGKGDDSLFFEQTKLHKEKAELLSNQRRLEKELRFYKELRSQSSKVDGTGGFDAVSFENSELLKKLDSEQETNAKLRDEMRKLKTEMGMHSDPEHNKQLYQSKIAQQKLQIQLQRMSAKMVHLKAKVQRLNLARRNTPYSPSKDVKILESELKTMQSGYESTLQWGYDQQSLLFEEQAKTELLTVQLEALKKKLDDPSFDVDAQLIDEMKERIQEAQTASNEINWARDAAVTLYHQVFGEDPAETDSTADILTSIGEQLPKP